MPPVEKTDPRRHYIELDALRGIAILGVVGCHVVYFWTLYIGAHLRVPLIGVDALEVLRFGNYGVSLFFLLSGYLLALTEEKRYKAGSYSVRSYALRRILRLAPAYYLAILIVVFTWPVHASLVDVLEHASFLHGLFWRGNLSLDGIWWSLTPEIIFYATLPLLVLRLRSLRARLALFAILAFISFITRLYIWKMGEPMTDGYPQSAAFWYWYELPTTHLYLFMAGVLLKMAAERLNTRKEMPSFTPHLASTLFVASVVLFVSFPYLWGRELGQTLTSPMGMLIDLLVISFFVSALLGSPLAGGLLALKPLAFLGRISYSLFLLHGTVLVLSSFVLPKRLYVSGEPGALWITFFVYAALILILAGFLAYLSYRYVESPFLRLRPREKAPT